MHFERLIDKRFYKFRREAGLEHLPDGIAFEKFVTYYILNHHRHNAFDVDSDAFYSVCVGGFKDTGIDGMGLFVNGELITEMDDLQRIAGQRKMEIMFVFIQTKYKAFCVDGMSTFFTGVRDFLSGDYRIPANTDIARFRKLRDFLFSREMDNMESERKFVVKMYYVAATGRWKAEQHVTQTALAEQCRRDVLSLDAYAGADVSMHFVDNDVLNSICKGYDERFEAQLNVETMFPLPLAKDVVQSCMLLCRAGDLCRIMDDGGVIRHSLFENNVRGFLRNSPINAEMQETIASEPEMFHLLNNGIVIACERFHKQRKQGNGTSSVTLRNPQIINGCQTSNVLYRAGLQGNIGRVYLQVKLIATKNTEVIDKVIRATNRQNMIADEAFEATKKFHLDLQVFFKNFSADYEKLSYERHPQTPTHTLHLRQVRTITLRILTQCFTAMFLNHPEESHRKTLDLLTQFDGQLFQETHSKMMYYATGLAFYQLDALFRKGILPEKAHCFKPHLLMMFREAFIGTCPEFNKEDRMDKYAWQMLDVLQKKQTAKSVFPAMYALLVKAGQQWKRRHHPESPEAMAYAADFTLYLLQAVRKQRHKWIQGDLCPNQGEGYVASVQKDRAKQWFGLIRHNESDVFFHAESNSSLNFLHLKHKPVRFKTTAKGETLVEIMKKRKSKSKDKVEMAIA